MPSCDDLIARYSIPTGDGSFDHPPPPEPKAPPSASIEMPQRIVIVGAGVKGLTVALELLRAFDAARLRKKGGEPQIVLVEADDSGYTGYQAKHRHSGLLPAAAVAGRELLAHVPVDPPAAAGSFAPSVRIPPAREGQTALDRFRPVRNVLQKPAGGVIMSSSNVPHNLSCCVDALLDSGAPHDHLATVLDLYVTYMHKDVSARWHVRDDCPEVAALLNPYTQFGRLQRSLALSCGGQGRHRAGGFALLHAASFAGILWPVGHPEGDGCPRLPAEVPEDPPAMWRCVSVVRDVLIPMRDLLSAHGVSIRYGEEVEVSGPSIRVVGSVELESFDILVDARSGESSTFAGGVLALPEYVAREYTRRIAASGVTSLHPESPWELVTTLDIDDLEVRVGAPGARGVRGTRLVSASPSEAAAEVLLQLGFSVADADSATWKVGPVDGGLPGPEALDVVLEPREARQLLAFEVGCAPVVVAAPTQQTPTTTPVGRVVHCRSQGASRHGPARSLGPSFEAGKLSVYQLAQALALVDELNSAAGSTDTLVCVPGLDLPDSGRRTLPEVRAMQRWALFNHLGQRLRIGYSLYVGQAVVGATLCLMLVCLVIVLPVVTVQRARRLRPLTVSPAVASAAAASAAAAPAAAASPASPAPGPAAAAAQAAAHNAAWPAQNTPVAAGRPPPI